MLGHAGALYMLGHAGASVVVNTPKKVMRVKEIPAGRLLDVSIQRNDYVDMTKRSKRVLAIVKLISDPHVGMSENGVYPQW